MFMADVDDMTSTWHGKHRRMAALRLLQLECPHDAPGAPLPLVLRSEPTPQAMPRANLPLQPERHFAEGSAALTALSVAMRGPVALAVCGAAAGLVRCTHVRQALLDQASAIYE